MDPIHDPAAVFLYSKKSFFHIENMVLYLCMSVMTILDDLLMIGGDGCEKSSI